MEYSKIWEDKTILIAEDELTNFMFLEEMLSITKAKIIWVKDGSEAIETVKKNTNIDLILMDVKMPLMNGYDSAKEIRKFSDIPIIAQTAYALVGEREESKKAGCNEYISKPFKIKDFFNLLEKYL